MGSLGVGHNGVHAHTHRVRGEETHPSTDKDDSSLILKRGGINDGIACSILES